MRGNSGQGLLSRIHILIGKPASSSPGVSYPHQTPVISARNVQEHRSREHRLIQILFRSLQPNLPTSSDRFTFSLSNRHLRVYLGDEMVREVNAFGSGEETSAFVGVMGCSPKGGGVEARFKRFKMRDGVRAEST